MKYFVLITLFSLSAKAELACVDLFNNSQSLALIKQDANSNALFEVKFGELVLSEISETQTVNQAIEQKALTTYQIIRPYLKDRIDNVFFITKYIQRSVSKTVEFITEHTQGLAVEFSEDSASLKMSEEFKKFTSLMDRLDKTKEQGKSRFNFRVPFVKQKKEDTTSAYLELMDIKQNIESLKEKVMQEADGLSVTYKKLIWFHKLLTAEIDYLNLVFEKIHMDPALDKMELITVSNKIQDQIQILETLKALTLSNKQTYEIKLKTAMSILNSFDTSIHINFQSFTQRHNLKELFERELKKKEEKGTLEDISKVRKDIIDRLDIPSGPQARLSLIYEIIMEKEYLSEDEALWLLKKIPLHISWGKDSNKDFLPLIFMKRLGIYSYSGSDFMPLDIIISVGILSKTRYREGSGIKAHLKESVMSIFRASKGYRTYREQFKMHYEILIDKLLSGAKVN